MKKKYTKIDGVKIAYKHPNNKLTQKERDEVEIKMWFEYISDTFNGLGWWIISKYNV